MKRYKNLPYKEYEVNFKINNEPVYDKLKARDIEEAVRLFYEKYKEDFKDFLVHEIQEER